VWRYEPVLSPAIPSDTAKLAQYQQETIHSTEKFEEEMVALGLVPASAASGSDDNDPRQPPPAEARRLSRFINNVDNHFAAKKQKKILNRARNLLLNQEANVCLKVVCTANMLPDVSSLLTINATANGNADKRRRRRQSAMRASAGAGSGGGADDVDVDENEEEGLRRIATQSKKGECHDVATGATPPTDDRVFIFQMPTCQVRAPHNAPLPRLASHACVVCVVCCLCRVLCCVRCVLCVSCVRCVSYFR
jgi:hypothetical protein